MDDIYSMLNNVLNDPEAMGKIEAIARGLETGGKEEKREEGGGTDPSSFINLQKAVSSMGQNNENVALLKALKPFLSEKRAKKVDDAVKIMGLLKLLPLLKEGNLFKGGE